MKWFGGILCIGLMSMLFTHCSKGGYTQTDPNHVIDFSDTTFPVIEITTPTADQEFKSGTAISITGKITDNSLYQGSINIKDEIQLRTLLSRGTREKMCKRTLLTICQRTIHSFFFFKLHGVFIFIHR